MESSSCSGICRSIQSISIAIDNAQGIGARMLNQTPRVIETLLHDVRRILLHNLVCLAHGDKEVPVEWMPDGSATSR